jgi:hypothetical protein
MSNGGGTGTRPGGLTALAVLNFVFGGLGALGLIVIFGWIAAVDQASGGEVSREAANHPGAALAWTSLLLGLATVVLLIVSGVGYLGQKKFLGRTMGNLYVLVSLGSSAVGFVAGAAFNIGTIIGLIYPLLTLFLINTTFKDDLVN